MKKKVIIVGCGFGGLNAAKGLRASPDHEILILDRRNHHLFQPLLYQVAMAGLSPAEISTPIRSVFRRYKSVRVLLAEVLDIDLAKKKVRSNVGDFEYDFLILACGAEHSYFGHEEWEDNAPGLKNIEQATEIRRRVLTAFERAEAQSDPALQKAYLTFAIVGGGPTGVELAGALGEITRFTLKKDFRHINPRHAHIVLIEAGPRLLPSFAADLGAKAVDDLHSLGVEIRCNSRVTDLNSDGLNISEEFLRAKTVIWAAGVKPSPLNKCLNSTLDKQGRVLIEPDLSLPAHREVYVLGDQAALMSGEKALPGLAPVAIQQGQYVAKLILGRVKSPFHYRDKGQMATIGRKSAVVEIGKLKFSGFFAWLLWLLIHIYFLIGFKNRFFVMWEWAFSYLSYRRGARLITRRDWHSQKVPTTF